MMHLWPGDSDCSHHRYHSSSPHGGGFLPPFPRPLFEDKLELACVLYRYKGYSLRILLSQIIEFQNKTVNLVMQDHERK